MNIDNILNTLNSSGISNKLEQAHFLGQADHESGGFTKLSEGTGYRFGRAKIIWPSRKDAISAKQKELKAADNDFCPQPWLFNTVYGSRMGNEKNGTGDNDGFDYRGAGLFQLTGTENYQLFLNWLHSINTHKELNINSIDDFVRTDEGAILSAIWYWKSKNLSVLALKDDITGITKKINGGTIGLDERKSLVDKYKKYLHI